VNQRNAPCFGGDIVELANRVPISGFVNLTTSLRAKILTGFAFVALLAGALGWYAEVQVGSVGTESQHLVDDGVAPLKQASAVQHLLDEGVTQGTTLYYVNQLMAAGGTLAVPIDQTIATYVKATQDATAGLKSLTSLKLSDAAKAKLHEVVLINSSLSRAAAKLFNVQLEVLDESAPTIDLVADVTAATKAISGQSSTFASFRDQVAADAAVHAATVADQTSTAKRNIVLAVIAVLGLSTVFGLVAAGNIGKRLKLASATLLRAADGDLTTRMTDNGKDELGQMSDALNQTLSHTSEVIQAIDGSAARLAISATSVEHGANSVVGMTESATEETNAVTIGVERAASFIGMVAAGTDEMASSIREIAERAQEAATTAATAVREANNTRAIITKLGESSNEIGDVLALIQNIAEQTNLLALNATIEAARAGEAGKGFAVVAGEVKELSHATEQATRQISERITTIQGDSREAIEAISRIGTVIDEIHGTQTTIAAAVEEQTAVTSEIGRSAGELGHMVADITARIEVVNRAMATAGEFAISNRGEVQQLLTLSDELKELVGRFHVSG